MAGFTDITSWSTVLSTTLNNLASGTLIVSSNITPPTTPTRFYLEARYLFGVWQTAAAVGLVGQTFIFETVDGPATNTLFADAIGGAMVDQFDLRTLSSTSLRYAKRKLGQAPTEVFRLGFLIPSGVGQLAASGNVIEISYKSEG